MNKFDKNSPEAQDEVSEIIQELNDQQADTEQAGGASSGYLCSITKECQNICWWY